MSVAQLDRALGYGPRCREFESSRARIMTSEAYVSEVFFALSQVLGDSLLRILRVLTNLKKLFFEKMILALGKYIFVSSV